MSGRSRRGRGGSGKGTTGEAPSPASKGPVEAAHPAWVAHQPPDETAGSAREPPAAEVDPLGLVLRDVQTPLAVLELNLALLSGELADAPADAAITLRDARCAARRIRQYIDHFVASEIFGELAMRRRRRRVDVSALLRRLVSAYRSDALELRVALELDLPSEPVICARADEVLLKRAFQNLLERALRLPSDGGRVLVQATHGSVAEIFVGCDAAATHVPALQDEALSPITLYGCAQAIEAHGGSLAIEHDPRWALGLRVRLPIASL